MKPALVRPAGLLDEFRALAEQATLKRGPRCAVCALDQETRDAIDQLKREGKACSVLSRILEMKGINIREAVIARHFRARHFREGHE